MERYFGILKLLLLRGSFTLLLELISLLMRGAAVLSLASVSILSSPFPPPMPAMQGLVNKCLLDCDLGQAALPALNLGSLQFHSSSLLFLPRNPSLLSRNPAIFLLFFLLPVPTLEQ